ncbi:hypothetical protein B0H11DRAFT_2224247 [Mycena galericulata]|nr:hypothetical protein B0H11DRAFT_2224247 [Mycena galericulata]
MRVTAALVPRHFYQTPFIIFSLAVVDVIHHHHDMALPLSVVCGNPATPWFVLFLFLFLFLKPLELPEHHPPSFPPFPLPLKWATRWWFARRHSAAWEFGPLDLYGNPRAHFVDGRSHE